MLNIYETVYGLSADPFRLSPDYKFSYSHPSYARSKAYLDYALLQGEGFVMITGAPGTGKTTLVREILATIDIAHIQVATLTSTQLRTRDLLQMVATAFGLRFKDSDKATLLTALEQSLQQQYKSGRRAVLIVDEAQGLSIDALEELRLLANLQSDNQMLMQVFLLGQEKLRDLINSPTMEQLRQRVVASSVLEQLDLDETVNYIEYRLNQAGWQGDPEVSGEALQLIHKYSGGVPRRINLICTRLLLSGGLKEKHVFAGKDVQDVILELQKEMLIDPDNAEIKVDDAVDVRSLRPLARDIAREEESQDVGKPDQRSASRDFTESMADDDSMQQPSARKSSDGLGVDKAASRDSTSNRNKKKGNKRYEQEFLAPAEHEIEAEIGDDAALIFGEGKNDNTGLPGHGQSITKRSIAMAAAMATVRSAPVSRGRKSEGGLATTSPELTSAHGNIDVTRPGPDERRTTVETARRSSSSLRKQFIIFLLAIGSLTAVAGVKFRDYVFTVSVQADNFGVIRSFVPGIENISDKIDKLVVKKNID